jgi:hypothetical protein
MLLENQLFQTKNQTRLWQKKAKKEFSRNRVFRDKSLA